MDWDIVKNAEGKFDLFVGGILVRSYTRKSDAKRGYERLCAAGAAAETAQAALADAPAAQPPASNTGGLKTGSAQNPVLKTEPVSERYSRYVAVNGKIKEIPFRKGKGTAAHIDTLTMTVTSEVFVDPDLRIDDEHPENVQLLACKISETLFTLLGFGIFEQKNGLNGYKYSFRLGTETANYGVVAFGGRNQHDSIMIYLYGEGCTAALDGWETHLYNWIQVFAPFAVFTRVDLAHDFENTDGVEFTPEMAKQAWINGGFTQRYTRPNSREHGSDWNNERYPELGKTYERTGKTFYVGSPESSRLVRVYDKGCELGDKTSPLVRFELQFRNRDYIIPHDILVKPGEYLTGAYPICEELFTRYETGVSKTERIKKTEIINLEHVVKYASQAASPCINALELLGFDDSEIKLLLKGGKVKIPKRLGADKSDCRKRNVRYIHEMKEVVQKHNSDIRNYMFALDEKEQSAKRQARFAKLEQEALLFRMQQTHIGHWTDAF